MEIRKATPNDFDTIYEMWKKNRKKLGTCWKATLERYIRKGEFYTAYENNKFVGMVCLHYFKKYNQYDIIALAIDEEYRTRGYGTELVKYAVSQIKCNSLLNNDIPIYVGALDGDVNNKFYDRFCDIAWYNEYKTCVTRVYRVDKNRLYQL